MQETTGDVAKAINDAYPAGSVLASSAYPGAEILSQAGGGVMDADNWTPEIDTLTTNPSSGILRVTRNGAANPAANQLILSNGTRYKLTGDMRGDGVAYPVIGDFSGNFIVGIASTSWQSFNTEVIANTAGYRLRAITTADTQYADYRNVSVREANPLNGDISGATIGQPTGLRALPYAYSFDGANDYIDIYSTALNSFINWNEGYIAIALRAANAGVWTDNLNRDFLRFQVDNSNRIVMRKDTANRISLQYIGAGTIKAVTEDVSTTVGIKEFLIHMTWDSTAGTLATYLNGVQLGTTQTGLVAASGALDANFCVIGAANNTPIQPWYGDIAGVVLSRRKLEASEALQQAQLLGVAP
ncbi:MAG: hypothetical protein GTO60_16735 [Gammaproteobacteria bacterium]|nr:hypothetical protein [Gammaproteobacteria bacterium]